MTELVIRYNDSGSIVSWNYEADSSYETEENELIAPDDVDHRELNKKRVDVTTSPPSLIDNPDFDNRTKAEKALEEIENLKGEKPVRRAKITQAEKQAFQDARDAGDIQAQLDALYEMLTGEKLE